MPSWPDGPLAVAVAHPDDETLWLSSVLGRAAKIVFCYGDPYARPKNAAARRRAVAALPLAGLADLALPESGAGFSVDWRNPRLTAAGLAITDPAAGARYDANYAALVERLRPLLTGMRHVFTHNPWGEYGHAEHVQVHRAVASLQAELGFTLWFSNYIGAASRPLARLADAHWSGRLVAPPDRALAHRLRDIYRRHGAWTWSRWHRWPEAETLYALAPDGQPMTGEMLLDVACLRPWRSRRRALTRI